MKKIIKYKRKASIKEKDIIMKNLDFNIKLEDIIDYQTYEVCDNCGEQTSKLTNNCLNSDCSEYDDRIF